MDAIKTFTERIREINNDLKSKEDSGDASLLDCLSAVGRVVDAYTELPPKETQLFHQAVEHKYGGLFRAILPASKTDEVLAVGEVVVTYRPNLMNREDDQKKKIRDAITALLTANPGVELAVIEDSLGIKVINVQRPLPPVPPSRKGFLF